MKQHHERLRGLGPEVAAVVKSRPEMLAGFLADEPLPFPLLADPTGAAYRAFGLERTSWLRMLRPGVILCYLWLMARGWGLRRRNEGEDVLQLGGDFLLDADQHVVYAYRSAEPTDRPTLGELVEAITGKF